MDVTASHRTAIYIRIAEDIGDGIQVGRWRPGQRIPTEQQLMAEYGAARQTVREAVRILRDEGLVEIRFGHGTFVRTRQSTRVERRHVPRDTVRLGMGDRVYVRATTVEECRANALIWGEPALVVVRVGGEEDLYPAYETDAVVPAAGDARVAAGVGRRPTPLSGTQRRG